MKNKYIWIVLAFLMMAACSKEGAAPTPSQAAVPIARTAVKPSATAEGSGVEQAKMAQRHVELRHSLVIRVAEDRLEAVWNERLRACQYPSCEVVTAEIDRQERDYSSANLVLRVDPAQAAGLLDTFMGLGQVEKHEMSQTDRTSEVIDVQAQLDNQKALRDRLRALMVSHAGKLSELLELERELARVQGEIDALTGKMRAVLQLTEKTTLEVRFRTPKRFSHGNIWAPVSNAWGEMGPTLAGSLAALLVVGAGSLPWLLVLCALIFGIRLLRRRARARAQVPPPGPAVS